MAVAPGVWRILAPNPGPYTGPGTNSYLLEGPEGWAVLDPGPAAPSHLAALQAGAGPIAWVWLSHAHPDHAEGVGAFLAATGAKLAAWPRPNPSFPLADLPPPDHALADGEALPGGFEAWQAWHTPGHASDHLVFARQGDGVVLCADQVLQGVTTSVMRPDGDMQAYLDSLEKLEALRPTLLLPSHGDPMPAASARIQALRDHRLHREAQILAALAELGEASPEALAQGLYPGLAPALHLAAAGQVEAHLVRLEGLGRVRGLGPGLWGGVA